MTEENKDMKVVHAGDFSLVHSSVGCYLFTAATQTLAQPGVLPFYRSTRRLIPLKVGNFEIVPRGESNAMPDEIREMLDEANLTPEILRKHTYLMYGQEPALYRIKFENGTRLKLWEEHKDIQSWLDSFDYRAFLQKKCVEFFHTDGHFSKIYRNKGPRIGRAGFISSIEHVSFLKCCLEWPDQYDKINRIIVGDWDQPWKKGLTPYPIWDKRNPFAVPVGMRYNCMYSFARDNDYSFPSYWGNRYWIRLSSIIAKLLTNYNENSSAIKWHIKVPATFWTEKENDLRKKCMADGVQYTDKMLQDLKDTVFLKFVETLSSHKNVGKFVTTDKFYDGASNTWVGWDIEPLDQKVKDFIDAQINISKRAALEITSGHGMHPAQSNISTDGNLPSGSEQLYAFKLYLMTGISIPEEIICRDINDAIEVNFPGSGLRIGFYHDVVLTEEATSPKDRIKNKSSKPDPNAAE
jgi:hypothetical protein